MLCSMLQSRLPSEIETIYLAHPSVSPEEILHAIAFELRLDVARDAGRMEVMQALYRYLLERHAQGKQVVIFIEESQNMPIATLEEVRLLSNLETGKSKLLQIVLFGQPELDENLRQPHIRQLRERITHSFTLSPLTPQEIAEYLIFRLRAVGYRGPDLFSANVIKRIAQASAGLTRRVNLIADKALLAAFSENTHTIQGKHIAAAIRDSEFARDSELGAQLRSRWLLITASGLLVLALAGYAAFRVFERTQTAPSKPSGETPASPAAAASNSRVSPPEPSPARNSALAAAHGAVSTLADAEQSNERSAEPARDLGAVEKVGAILVPDTTMDVAVVHTQQGQHPEVTAALNSTLDPSEKANEIQGDVLAARLQATREWLRVEAAQTHSIQLLGTDKPQKLKHHLNEIAKSIEINNVFVYRTLAKQKPFMSVLYGRFPSRKAAQEALDRLPPALRAFKPYLRTVQGILEEMSRNNTL
jgi:type II secretory pathway predicted ATPase ExeA/septal ring-binding cell division protein DamX